MFGGLPEGCKLSRGERTQKTFECVETTGTPHQTPKHGPRMHAEARSAEQRGEAPPDPRRGYSARRAGITQTLNPNH